MTKEHKIKGIFKLRPVLAQLEKEIEQMEAVCSFLENQKAAEMVAQELIKKQKNLVMNKALLNVLIHQDSITTRKGE